MIYDIAMSGHANGETSRPLAPSSAEEYASQLLRRIGEISSTMIMRHRGTASDRDWFDDFGSYWRDHEPLSWPKFVDLIKDRFSVMSLQYEVSKEVFESIVIGVAQVEYSTYLERWNWDRGASDDDRLDVDK